MTYYLAEGCRQIIPSIFLRAMYYFQSDRTIILVKKFAHPPFMVKICQKVIFSPDSLFIIPPALQNELLPAENRVKRGILMQQKCLSSVIKIFNLLQVHTDSITKKTTMLRPLWNRKLMFIVLFSPSPPIG